MASKEASTTPAKEATKPVGEFYAFEFKLEAAKIGALTTDKQVKAKVSDAFMGYGAFDECRVSGGVGKDRVVTVFFARLFGKGQPAWEAVKAGEKPTINIYDETVVIGATDAKPSGGGAATGTSFLPKKEAKKEAKKGGRGRGEEGKDGKESKDGKDAGRGRGRGAKKEEVKGPSLQRGRANIGGALGPVSKVRLAKIEKAKKEKDLADRIARGEKIEEVKKEEDTDPSLHLVKPKAKDEKGKKEAGKAEAGKKEGGKKEAGKAEGGKKEAAKAAPAKKK